MAGGYRVNYRQFPYVPGWGGYREQGRRVNYRGALWRSRYSVTQAAI